MLFLAIIVTEIEKIHWINFKTNISSQTDWLLLSKFLMKEKHPYIEIRL